MVIDEQLLSQTFELISIRIYQLRMKCIHWPQSVGWRHLLLLMAPCHLQPPCPSGAPSQRMHHGSRRACQIPVGQRWWNPSMRAWLKHKMDLDVSGQMHIYMVVSGCFHAWIIPNVLTLRAYICKGYWLTSAFSVDFFTSS